MTKGQTAKVGTKGKKQENQKSIKATIMGETKVKKDQKLKK